MILHADAALLVADKPAGLPTVPGRPVELHDCLWQRVRTQYADALVVHRLDMATSGLMLLYLCLSVPEALMQRAFRFKQRMIIQPAAKIAFAGVSIVFAVWGFGAWSMVIGSYASIITLLVLSWSMARWRPFRGRFSVRLWREMAKFSLPLVLEHMADSIRDTFQQVLLGRRLGTADLGQYRYG